MKLRTKRIFLILWINKIRRWKNRVDFPTLSYFILSRLIISSHLFLSHSPPPFTVLGFLSSFLLIHRLRGGDGVCEKYYVEPLPQVCLTDNRPNPHCCSNLRVCSYFSNDLYKNQFHIITKWYFIVGWNKYPIGSITCAFIWIWKKVTYKGWW